MEVGEQPTLRLLNEILHPRRNAEPLEFARHQLVARHHRLHALDPVLVGQRAPASLRRFEPVRDGSLQISYANVPPLTRTTTTTYSKMSKCFEIFMINH